MRTQRQVSVGELVEEAKKRIVFLIVCVIGLAYLMSLTSSSVWINLPAAASLILLLRYFSLDYEMRRKAATYSNSKASSADPAFPQNPQLTRNREKFDWRKKVNSPVVEEAVDHFTRRLISEWVTDLWYSRLTPDKDGPEELVQIVNGVIGEFSSRMRNLNLIDLLIRDLIHLICTHLELFRATQGKIEKHPSGLLSFEQRDKEMRRVLAAESRLHPALFSAEAEHKVLQHVMDGLISFTFRPEDLQCSFFRFVVRELLACAVMRPVLNLANPRFINERIEILVLSRTNKGVATAEEASQSKPDESSKTPSDHFSRNLDPTAVGVELVQLKANQSKKGSGSPEKEKTNGIHSSKDPLLSIDTRSSRSWSSLPSNPKNKDELGIPRFRSGGEWGDMLDVLSQRKSAALAPENFENMWTKGRNYRKKDDQNWSIERNSQNKITKADKSKTSVPKEKHGLNTSDVFLARNGQSLHLDQGKVQNSYHRTDQNSSNHSLWTSYDEDDGEGLLLMDESESGSASPYTSEEEDPSSVTGLDDPGTKVWDRRTNRNLTVSPIHHPLENPHRHGSKKTTRGQAHYEKVPRPQSGRKRSRPSNQKAPAWQEVERTSFLSGEGQDLLSSKGHSKLDASSDDSEVEGLARAYSGATACSSAISDSISEIHCSAFNSTVDSFFKLRCEVTGANIVKSASRTFAVYSISVTDVNNNSWSIKRRFRHFEELHRRLKEYPEYNLHLPPKHFLSTGLDMPVIQERCKLLDRYLKKLLQLPTISGSIEVWDFLSVDSQTYIFSNSFSIVQTLSVDLDDKPTENSRKVSNSVGLNSSSSGKTGKLETERKESASQTKCNFVADGVRMAPKHSSHSPVRKLGKDSGKLFEESASIPDAQKNALSVRNIGKTLEGRQTDRLEPISESLHDLSADPTVPTEWVSPNLTAPILDLVDVVFQLQDGGWIRRQAFWVAKQILSLGMGDALDDWLIEKIQLLRMGPVVASGIKRLEQILWPDGIFLTKHPRRRQSSTNSAPYSSPHGQQPADMSSPKLSSSLARQPSEISSPRLSDELQQREADRRAKFVYELMIDNAPATIVSLVGRKEYEQCAKDLYFFLQSSVCLKLLAFELLELLLLTTFPELDYVFRQLHDEKHRFGELKIKE